jgi:amino acid adenylation domain-containing protein
MIDLRIAPSQTPWFHTSVEFWAANAAESAALTTADSTISYGELNRRANQVATFLQSRKLGRGALIGLSMERSVAFVTALVGILKAGAAYVPLDPAYPRDRLAFMLEDAQIPLIFTQPGLTDRLPPGPAERICLDSAWFDAQDLLQADWTPIELAEDDLAYVIYTSGTTGRPKGVQVRHAGLSQLIAGQIELFGIAETDRVLQFASISFDASISEIGMALAAGATLHLAESAALLPGPDLLETLRKAGITTVTLPPTALAALPCEPLADLRRVIVAGEPCPAELVTRWAPGRAFYNAYGPTEVTVCATAMRCTADGARPAIGHPLPHITIHVLNADLRPVEPGEIGTIYVGGSSLAQGYLNQPGLTAEKFIPDPFAAHPGQRLYNTGDLGRFTADQCLQFIGRADQQIKLRGYRIELGEIEAVLEQYPQVRASAAIMHPRPEMQQVLAYVSFYSGGAAVKGPDLRQFLRQMLPEYMVPATITVLDDFPLTPNGKIDRAALPLPGRTRPALNCLYTPLDTELEHMIAALWGELFNIEGLGAYDDFFELGGHSLLATQMIVRIQDRLGISLSLQSIFAHPILRDFAAHLEQCSARQAPLASIERLTERTTFPLSFAQEQVWFINQLNGYTIAYHAQATIRFSGILDQRALERSFTAIIERHEIFRTTFPTVNSRPVQIIHPAQPVQIPVISLEELPPEDREQAIAGILREELARPFDLSTLPLIRPVLLRIHAHEHLLVYIEHHMVHDGWSFGIFLRELLAFYQAFCAGQTLCLPAPPVRFADFAAWQRQWMATEEASAQLNYWQQRLADVPHVLSLPTDHPRPSTQSLRGAALRVELAPGVYSALKRLSHETGTTLFMTMLAAFQTLLYRYTGQADVSVGSGVANRSRSETEGLIGMLVNIVVLHSRLSGQMTFRELLAAVRDTTLGAYANQDIPFEKVVEAVQPDRSLSHNPLFQVAFSFHDNALPNLRLSDVTVDVKEAQNNGSAKFDLNIVVIPRAEQYVGQIQAATDQGVTMIWEYSTDLFEQATISRMADHYQRLLSSLIVELDQPLATIPLLLPDEQERLLGAWNATEQPFSQRQTLPQLIAAQAQSTPHAPAVVFEGQQVSYAALNRQADRLARLLQSAGVAPQQPVALYLDRSLLVITGILGILKARAIYVPVDPAYPAERIRFMLEDSGAPVILTSSQLAGTLPPGSHRVICLDTLAPDEAEPADAAAGEAGDIAYIIYTSGSTGRPKGVACTHAGVLNLLEDFQARQPIGPGDQCSLWTSLSFDVSIYEIFAALTAGVTLHIVPEQLRASGPAFISWLADHSISSAYLPPFMVPDLVERLGMQRERLSLRRLLVGVEPISEPDLVAISAGIPGLRIINGYGPTEASICATLYEVDPASQHSRTTPIGRPTRNTQLYVLDQAMQLVPQGVPGELYIGGLGLAAGYWNQPELTSERFVANPFSAQPGARLYRTGDQVRYLADGNLEFLGRQDNQVKIRGYRIELGEIEAVLKAHPAVKDALVEARDDHTGGKRLVAYVIPQNSLASMELLRVFMRERLPEHMIPTAFLELDALPVTSNGKINRAALPDPAPAEPAGTSYTGPRDSFEIHLQQIWERLFDLHPISVTANFFELGGHSILAAHMMIHIQEELGQKLPLSVLFQGPTIEYLATLLRENNGAHATSSLVNIHTQGHKQPFFCVHSANGEVFSYIELARALGDEYPVYGLQAAALYGENHICNRMEDIAACYIDEMRRVQPHGPYYLGGWCTGGTIAFEISQQLKQQGQEVGLLALLDSHPNAKVPEFPHGADDEATWMNLFFHDHLLIRYDELPRFEREHLDVQWQFVKAWIKTEDYWPPNVGIPYLKHQIGIFRAIMQGIYGYTPPVTNQRMVVFLPEQHADVDDQTLGWHSRTTAKVSVEIVPGNHDSFIQAPNVQVLADRLRTYLSAEDR